MTRIVAILVLLFLCFPDAMACTAAVISGKATSDGRPLLWKHRDTDELDNRLEYFSGAKYSFTGLVNSHGQAAPSLGGDEREVWIGANTAGFSIMNTASYNLNQDDVPLSSMDREGILIYKALGLCRTASDFEFLLDTLPKPLGVEAEFAVIDAEGGAVLYEVGNYSYVKYDANDPETAPGGYIVFTNFSFSGRESDRKGYERYVTASAVFDGFSCSGGKFTPSFIFENLSRSYRNDFMGVDYGESYCRMKEEGMFTGIVPDSDFIPRRSTSASVVVQGVLPGENPLHSVIWTLLGYPLCGTAVPVPVSRTDIVPDFLKSSDGSSNSIMCDIASGIKYSHVFRFSGSNGHGYLDLSHVFSCCGGPSLFSSCLDSDREIRESFVSLHEKYTEGDMSEETFYKSYLRMSPTFFKIYKDKFKYFIGTR